MPPRRNGHLCPSDKRERWTNNWISHVIHIFKIADHIYVRFLNGAVLYRYGHLFIFSVVYSCSFKFVFVSWKDSMLSYFFFLSYFKSFRFNENHRRHYRELSQWKLFDIFFYYSHWMRQSLSGWFQIKNILQWSIVPFYPALVICVYLSYFDNIVCVTTQNALTQNSRLTSTDADLRRESMFIFLLTDKKKNYFLATSRYYRLKIKFKYFT